MAKNLYCSCGNLVGNCGHVQGGTTATVYISGTCAKCQQSFSVSCSGDCL